MSKVNSKLVLVTGAGRGIGRAIALKLADEGFTVAACARTRAELDETAKLSKGAIRATQIDVTKPEQLTAWIDSEAAQGTLWGLVTAAGIHGSIGPFLETPWAEWQLATDVNLYGTALAVQRFAQKLVAHKQPGRIVLLSGGGATKAIANMTAYCASKSAVVRFGETMAEELAPHGITVNSIAPGGVNTAMTQTIITAGPAKSGQELFNATLKQTKEGGTPPEKAAALASYLLSEQAAPVTGRLISAVWDDWASLHANSEILGSKDYYKLRRLLPTGPGVK